MPNRRGVFVACGAIALCGWTAWVSGFPRASPSAVATWLVSLLAVLAVDVLLWQGQRGRSPGVRLTPARMPWPRSGCGGWRRALVGVSPWLALSAIVLIWEILGIDTGRRAPHLTISSLTAEFRPLHAAMLLVWMLAGLGYGAARARAPLAPQAPTGAVFTPGAPPPPANSRAVPVPLMPALLLPASNPAGVAFWIAVVLAAVAIDLAGRRSGGRLANAEELLRFVTTDRLVNALVVVAWTYAGYHLFAH